MSPPDGSPSEPPVISKELLEILVCPETRTPLSLAGEELVDRVNQAIGEGRLRNKAGETLRRPLEGGLVRADGSTLYGIVDGIPVLLIDESIELGQLADQ
jgi:uncharacterized protein YbaR (Trm112 family)